MPGAGKLEHFRISMIRRARLEHAGVTHSVLLLDVGLRGVFVEWKKEPLDRDGRIRISFKLPGNENPIESGCRVAWWNDATKSPTSLPTGMGLEFVDISEADHARLRALLEEHNKRDPRARQFTRWWPESEDLDQRS